MERVLSFIFLCISTVLASANAPWSYHSGLTPEKWYQKYPLCAGRRQSPINIERVRYGQTKKFRFYNFNKWNNAKLSNNGHSVQVTLSPSRQHIKGGGLDDAYNAVQFHFHWGSDSRKGSEHLINGKAFPLEMHIVHYKAEYKTIGNALAKKDGLAVLGVLFRVGAYNRDLAPILANFHKIRKAGSSITIREPEILKLLPWNKDLFYRYQGSLTTPKCNEAVVWTLFKHHVTLSSSQLRMFKLLMTKDGHTPIVNNYRPTQKLNGRLVYSLRASAGYDPWDLEN